MTVLNRVALTTAAALCLGISLPACATEPVAADTVWVVDYSGRPPFKRQRVQAPAAEAEFARLEEELPELGKRVQVVDFSGRPPYRRTWVTVDAQNQAEFARFEEVSDDDARPKRRGPPGKGMGYRR